MTTSALMTTELFAGHVMFSAIEAVPGRSPVGAAGFAGIVSGTVLLPSL